MIEVPKASEWIPERRLVRFYFNHQPAAVARVYGSIAWPLPEGEGVALIAGETHPGKTIVVWETFPFNTILPVFKGDEQSYQGLAEFFGRCWTLYRCRTFFWGHDPADVVKHYAQLIYAAETIQPPPQLVEVKHFREEAADALFAEVAARGGAMIDKHNDLLRSHLAMQDEPERARGYHALRVLLMGFSRMPYRG